MRKRLTMAMLILFGAAGFASAQTLPQTDSQPPAKTKKAAKVWTDDNIGSVRTAADDYMIEQQKEQEVQQAATEQEAVQKAAAAKADAAPTWPQPKTVDQADQMIAQKQHFLSSEQSMVQELQKEVNDPAVTGFERTRIEWRLKSHSVTVQDTKTDVSQLEADKKALEKKAATKKGADATGSDSAQN